MSARTTAPLWQPELTRRQSSHIAQFIAARRTEGVDLPDTLDHRAFSALHQWSIRDRAAFWSAVWRDAHIIADTLRNGAAWDAPVAGGERMAPPTAAGGPRWFVGARLNFAENLLRHRGAGSAIVAWDERGRTGELSWEMLRDQVARAASALRALGVEPGDRVAGWLPNIPESVVAMLAAAAIGAVWTSCSPDFGNDGIVDRFGQTEPVVLLFVDGYRYGGKIHPTNARADELLARLPSVRHAVMIDYLGDAGLPSDPRAQRWTALLDIATPALAFERAAFDHPLYILYSSGTTGLPKCIVHSAGGALLQLVKEHRLHVDLRAGERLFYFTTCGWMMWNWQVNALAVGVTLVLYDGAPLPEAEPDILWRMASAERVDVFGTSAKYLALAAKSGMRPRDRYPLGRVRALLSTGSPLAPEGFDWVAAAVGPHVQTSSISGGTDIVSCFVLGNPLSPVWRGEIQGPGLGLAVEVLRNDGTPAPRGEPGELVCTAPFPAMPIAFWADPSGTRYQAAYFDAYPGVWRHGDWITETPHDGYVISGRSDATLNPGGVRIGTAEIYRQVEAISQVIESLVVGQPIATPEGADERIVLFVRLRDGATLDAMLQQEIRSRIRRGTSPHHVPRIIVAVTDLPRTRSGKLSELAVRDVLAGREVKNLGALANPEALEQFRNRPELTEGREPRSRRPG